jgi:PHD/YefM family antitoxin component YafN of YafNO toxin-antitoxin module
MINKNDNFIDLLGQPDEVRAAVRVTEVTGVRTVFTREAKNVAILLSWDEYVALAETVRLAGDPATLDRIGKADEELGRSGGIAMEDVLDG